MPCVQVTDNVGVAAMHALHIVPSLLAIKKGRLEPRSPPLLSRVVLRVEMSSGVVTTPMRGASQSHAAINWHAMRTRVG